MKNYVLISIFCVIFGDAQALTGHNSSHYEMHGTIFYDLNMNGIMDGGEWGIGGVQVNITDGQSAFTNHQGRFQIEATSKRADASLSIDKKTLPAGSILTSPDRFYLNPQTSFYRDFNFGLNYPESKKTFIVPHSVDKKQFLYVPINHETSISLKNNGIYIDKKRWQKLKSNKLITTKELTLSFREPSLRLTPASLRKLRQAITDNISSITIEVSASHDEEEIALKKAQSIAGDIKILLLKQSIHKNKITIKTHPGMPFIKLVITYDNLQVNRSCSFSSPTTKSFKLNQGDTKKLSWNLSSPVTYRLYCTNKSFILHLPSLSLSNGGSGWNSASPFIDPVNTQLIKLDFNTNSPFSIFHNGKKIRMPLSLSLFTLEEFHSLTLTADGYSFSIPIKFSVPFYYSDLIEKNQGTLDLYYPKHIDESRDLQIFFRGKTNNLRKTSVHGKAFHTSSFGYLHHGVRGKNSLYVQLQDVRKKNLRETHSFKLYPEPKYKFQINWGEHKKNSTANFYDTSYTLPLVEFFDISFQYFHNTKWGANFFFRTDIIPTQIETMTSGFVQVRHTDIRIHAAKRYFLNNQKYYSPKLIFYGGLQSKSFLTDESVVVNYPTSFLGLHGGTEFLAEHVIFAFLDLSTKAMLGLSFLDLGDITLQLSQEFRFDLNVFGIFTPVKPYFNKYYRYRYLQQFDFVLGIHLEKDYRTIANVSKSAQVDETKWLFSLGLTFHY